MPKLRALVPPRERAGTLLQMRTGDELEMTITCTKRDAKETGPDTIRIENVTYLDIYRGAWSLTGKWAANGYNMAKVISKDIDGETFVNLETYRMEVEE